MRSLFIDTSAWYALADKNDGGHKTCAALWNSLSKSFGKLYTSSYVFDETITLVRMNLGHSKAVKFGDSIRESRALQYLEVNSAVCDTAWQLFQKYDDKLFSFTDCTSFALMSTLEIETAFTLDRDFCQAGFKVVPQSS